MVLGNTSWLTQLRVPHTFSLCGVRSWGRRLGDKRHGVDAARIDAASAVYTLKPEQDAALRHLTKEAGFAMLWGEAGTGKSHTLNATRAAYEAAGKDVRGLAWTNDVAQQMRGDGFRQANTLAAEMNALEQGRTRWNRDTVLIVDEAAMLSTKELARAAAAARDAGAKLILVGDDKQLASIERGGMFETLRQTHGAATLKDVQRVRDAEQKAAFGKMHEGEFLQALKTFDAKGGIHWTDRQKDTLKDMAARYSADVAATPDKHRFMFAYTNKDVASLNDHARALHRQRGELGEDHSLATKQGEAQFAEGDRIQFTGNGRTKAEKNAGLTNGRVGTVTALEIGDDGKARMSVSLDVARGDKPQTVSFIVGEDSKAGEFNTFKHGYAGTIYRGQGRTLDEAYVAHSAHWRSAASYVALTRHREGVHIFAARETVKDLEAMAAGMGRPDNKRAASAYSIDPQSLVALEMVIEELTERRPDITASASRGPAVAQAPLADRPDVTRQTAAPADRTASHTRAEVGERAHGATARRAGKALGGAAEGAARVLGGVAEMAGRAIESLAEGLAGLFGGGSSAPTPEHEQQQPEPPPVYAKPEHHSREGRPTQPLDAGGRKPLTMEEFLAIERRDMADRAARVQELAHRLGISERQDRGTTETGRDGAAAKEP